MGTPKETPERGIPVGRMLIILTVVLVVGLTFVGMRDLMSGLTLSTPPVAGEWQAHRKPWRLTLNPDKSLVSSTGPAQDASPEPWATAKGTYSVDYFGNLWVKLDNGKVYTAALSTAMPNRFDLIESGTEAVTQFERIQPPKPEPSGSEKESKASDGP